MISIKEAIQAIDDGKIIVYPTDTVWGMGCDPFNQKAVNKLFDIKGKKENGLSIILNKKELINDYCITNQMIHNIIDNFLPGPITLILKSKKKFAKGVTKNGNIGIRIPEHTSSISLTRKTPIVTTSANKHGKKTAENLQEAKAIFGLNCFYLEGEEPEGVESTIIDMTTNKPKIKRIGALYSNILEGLIES